jgi:hypothetical protein
MMAYYLSAGLASLFVGKFACVCERGCCWCCCWNGCSLVRVKTQHCGVGVEVLGCGDGVYVVSGWITGCFQALWVDGFCSMLTARSIYATTAGFDAVSHIAGASNRFITGPVIGWLGSD